MFKTVLLTAICAFAAAHAALTVTETASRITLKNTRLTAIVAKPKGAIVGLTLDGQDLLGAQSGSTGQLYLDCYCIPSGAYTVGSTAPSIQVVRGTDSTGTAYGGVVLSDTYTPTGQFFQQFWFLRDGETGLHAFSRVAYHNKTTPFLRNLQELRTLFRPNVNLGLWTHLTSTKEQTAPLPSKDAVARQIMVQDATWSLENTPNDGYFKEFSEYFTKYTFATDWRQSRAHGVFADGSTSNGTSFGAWLVMNTKDTYFGGPLHSDLTVDGIVYNYLVSNHHGEGTPNITTGFDRTFGPHYYHFNSAPGASIDVLRADAEKYADPAWNAPFYDSIAPLVTNYVTTRERGVFAGTFKLPANATRPLAVLTANGVGFQDNAEDPAAYQYWGDINSAGRVTIPRVKAGIYRLTVYADGVFGDYIQDTVVVAAQTTTAQTVVWKEDSAGTEIWRLGVPDKSSGEFRHGNARDLTRPHAPREYLVYWGAYDFPNDFPEGVDFTIGASNIATDFNTVHWGVFGPTYKRPGAYTTKMNNWTINFDLTAGELQRAEMATLTIQLAGAKTAMGNTDVYSDTEPYSNMVLTAVVNDRAPGLGFKIPYYRSSSCIVRSAVSCYQLASKMVFPAGWLRVGRNRLVLSLPFNATDTETAVLPASVYVQYDALRLELG